MIRKIRHIIPKHSLIIIHKSFVRPHLDYGDIIHATKLKGFSTMLLLQVLVLLEEYHKLIFC